jgi:hypothetical protein
LFRGQTALILQSTNFPIEKIEPMTRHSELPDEARNQLDEVEKYMKSEMQTCNFLKKNKMSSKAEEIQKIKKDTESMVKVRMAAEYRVLLETMPDFHYLV